MKNILILALSVFTLYACTPKEEKKEEVAEDITPGQLKAQIDSLQNQMKLNWDTMISNDDSKLSSIKRLIEELSYIEGASKDSVKLFQELLEKTRKQRYTQEGLTSNQIDEYDAAQEVLITRVFGYAATIPQVSNYPMVKELQTEITDLDQKVVFLRSGYDQYAIPYNELLKKYPNTLSKLKPKYATMKVVGVFSIMEETPEGEDTPVQ